MRQGTHHSPKSRAAIAVGVKSRLDYHEASAVARALLYGHGDDELLRLAVGEALALAPDGMKRSWQMIANALARGRRIKRSAFPFHLILPADDELVRDVESAFEPE